MSAARRHKKYHHEEHENHERWLVSGYDMMTLLFAVFVVLFAISSTNISKVKLLEQSLQEAFSGPVLTGGRAMMNTGDTSDGTDQSPPEKPLPFRQPHEPRQRSSSSAASAWSSTRTSATSRTSRSASTSWPRRPAWRRRCRRR